MTGTTKRKGGQLDRREFLQWTAMGSAGAALSPVIEACAQLDRSIVGDGSDETQSVMILGAGISGLVAARELKKNGIPFRIFEGAQRIGGRALTLQEFNPASQAVDLGAEWISTNDEFVIGLCRELKVGLETLSVLARSPQFFQGEQVSDFESTIKSLKLADKKILEMKDRLNDSQWDAISAEEMLTDLRSAVDEKSFLWIHRMIQLEWGIDAGAMSALTLLDRFGSAPSGWRRALEKRVRLTGGMQNLAQALYDKVSGVVPERFVIFDHKLTAIKSRDNRLKMEFETRKGGFSIDARVVICTLPFSALREVKGIDELEFSPLKVKAIQELGYGSHGKLAVSFKDRFWQPKSPIWTGNLKSQWIWDSGSGSSGNFGTRGVLTAQLSADQGRNLGPQSMLDFKEDLKKINSAANSEEENSQMMNWSLNPWSRGSVSYFAPGQVHAFSSTLVSPERRGTFIFAGEHTSLSSMGTVNGAVESGIRAAIEAARFKSDFGNKF